MHLPRLRKYLKRHNRGLICGLLLFGQVVGAFGYPVISARTANGCEERACGCPEEQQAKHACCCAQADKLALPPCCAKHTKKSCCADTSTHSPAVVNEMPKSLRWASMVAARNCRGESPSGITAAEPLISGLAGPPAMFPLPQFEVLLHNSKTGLLPAHLPPTPPPRTR
jgi:hypothetical protein